MDLDLLRKTAKAFIYPNKRERFLLEMTRGSKDTAGGLTRDQQNAVCRLPEIIDPSLMQMESMHFPPPDWLISLMQQNGVGGTCFVICEYAHVLYSTNSCLSMQCISN